jgi:hypothetical protein
MDRSMDFDFWNNQLEVPVEALEARMSAPAFFPAWVRGLSPACRAVLADHLGFPADLAAPLLHRALLRFRDRLTPFPFVDAAMAGKRKTALFEVADAVLSEPDRARVRAGHRDDPRALAWVLYLRGRTNVQRVFQVDRIHRRGAARMVLSHAPPVRVRAEDFCRNHIASIVRGFGAELDPAVETLTTAEHHVVFLKWPVRPAFVVRGAENVFGLQREWIVLAFSHDLWRVRIASDAPCASAMLANGIASALLGQPVTYANESIATPIAAAERFVRALLDEPDDLPIVELETKTEHTTDAAVLRLHSRDNRSIAAEVRQLAAVFGDHVTRVPHLDGVKVFTMGKRVRLTFEPAPGGAEVVVRYTDQVFAPPERDAFERHMRDAYGLHVLSTEKRHAA